MRMTQMKGMTIPWVRAVHRSNRTSYRKSQKCQKKSRALPLPPKVRSLHHCLQTDNGEKESFALFHFLMMRINHLRQRYPFLKYSAFYCSLLECLSEVWLLVMWAFHLFQYRLQLNFPGLSQQNCKFSDLLALQGLFGDQLPIRKKVSLSSCLL